MPRWSVKEKWYYVSVTFCTGVSFLLLYIFREADDNRLTSWKWAFEEVEITWFLLAVVSGILIISALLNSPVTRLRPALFLFLSSFAMSALFWKVPEVIVDTSRYFTQAKHLEIYGIPYFITQWGKNINAWTDLPLVPFIYGVIFKYLGESRAFIQVFTSLIFSMTVVLTYLTGRTLWDEETGFIAGTLLWGIPYIFSQTPLMLVDVPTMFFLTCSLYSFIKALQRGGGWSFFAAISIVCAVFSKYSSWMMLSVLGVVFPVFLMRNREALPRATQPGPRDCMSRGLLVALIAGVLIALFIYYKYDVISGQIAFLREYQAPGLRRWGESFASTFLFQTHPFITIAALLAVYEALRKKDWKFLIIAWLMLLIVLFQIRRARYVMVIFPMVTLMASCGLQKIKPPGIRRFIVSCSVAVSLAVALFAYVPFLQSISLANLKKAGSFLDSIETEKVEVYTVPSAASAVNPSIAVPLLDLYTQKHIHYHPDENFSLPADRVETSPLRFTWEYKNPAYYISDKEVTAGNPALAIISNHDMKVLPKGIEERLIGYEKIEEFDTTSGRFRYSPVVSIYLRRRS